MNDDLHSRTRVQSQPLFRGRPPPLHFRFEFPFPASIFTLLPLNSRLDSSLDRRWGLRPAAEVALRDRVTSRGSSNPYVVRENPCIRFIRCFCLLSLSTLFYRADIATVVRLFVSEIQRQTEAEVRQHFPEGVLATLASRFSPITSPSQESDILKTPALPLPPVTRLPQLSPIARLPQELVDAIIAYCIYNTRTLQACSLTCYSWYIAAVRHLHYSLTTDDYVFGKDEENYRWPTPLQQPHDLGLLPLVRRFRIRLFPYDSFAPERLCRHNLHYFSTLTNLQELGIDDLQVSSFMPNIQQCFGHFAPTL